MKSGVDRVGGGDDRGQLTVRKHREQRQLQRYQGVPMPPWGHGGSCPHLRTGNARYDGERGSHGRHSRQQTVT